MSTRHLYFITHPNVLIDPTVPVPQWPLSERGLARMCCQFMVAAGLTNE